jgi:hypothetical protein
MVLLALQAEDLEVKLELALGEMEIYLLLVHLKVTMAEDLLVDQMAEAVVVAAVLQVERLGHILTILVEMVVMGRHQLYLALAFFMLAEVAVLAILLDLAVMVAVEMAVLLQ